MRFIHKIIALSAAVGILPLAAQGPVPAAPQGGDPAPVVAGEPSATRALTAADLEAWLDGFMPYALARGQIAGAVVVAVKDGQPLVEKGYGFSDVAAHEPVDPATTMFRPGSISKLFTWTAVMQQVEEGKLDLDTDVNNYLDFKIPPYEGKPVTLRNIMTHTAGFEESVRHLISSDPKAVMPLSEYAKEALPARVFAPGSTPAYSNYATALAGYIVERVSGMSFDDYIEQHIFNPLGMKHSTFRQPLPAAFEPYMSKGYSTVGQKPKPYEIVIPAPAGSLASSGEDMGKFMLAHLDQGAGLLKPETALEMHDFKAPNIGPLNTMALGFYEQWVNGHRAIAHGGDTGQFHSYLWIFPTENIGLYISMNSSGKEGSSQAVRAALLQRFADRYMPETRTFAPIDEKTAHEHASMLVGNYVASRGSFTNFMSVLGLLSPTSVVVGPDGQIMVPSLDPLAAGVRDWVEVEPFVWRDRNTGERLAAEVRDGRVERFSLDAMSPFTVLTRAPAGASLILPAILGALAIALLAALAWPVRALVRRNYRAEFALSGRSRLAYRLSRSFAWLVLAALAGWAAFVAAFSNDIGAIGGPLDWLLTLLRIVTPLATLGLLATAAWHLGMTFRDKRRWTMKLGAALLTLAGIVLVWVTFHYHLYGFGVVY